MHAGVHEYGETYSARNSYSVCCGKQMMNHTPVLVPEVLQYLLYEGTELIFDGTVGSGGHADAILSANPNIRLIGVDRDPAALRIASDRLARYGKRVRLVRSVFSDLDRVLAGEGMVDGVFLDLGVSSMQLDQPVRGFSHRGNGPLDMRMESRGPTAREWIETTDVEELARALRKYGEVRRAKTIARSIKKAADTGELNSTGDLKAAVKRVSGAGGSTAALSRVFQAIRICLNSELDMLESILGRLFDFVNPSGRIVIISYHSLEDRAVKSFFRKESSRCTCAPGPPVCVCGQVPRVHVLTRRVIKPSSAEIDENSRCRSARMRAAEVLGPRSKS